LREKCKKKKKKKKKKNQKPSPRKERERTASRVGLMTVNFPVFGKGGDISSYDLKNEEKRDEGQLGKKLRKVKASGGGKGGFQKRKGNKPPNRSTSYKSGGRGKYTGVLERSNKKKKKRVGEKKKKILEKNGVGRTSSREGAH